MNCASLTRWLDEGMPERQAAAARAHASGCPDCASRIREAERVEAMLGSPAAGAPAGFEDRVLARIAAEPPPRAVSATPAANARRLPWWSWIGADAALPVALAAASVLLGLIQAVFVLAERPLLLPLPALPLGAVRDVIDGSPFRVAAVALALLPPLLFFSRFLYRSIQGVVRADVARR